ncbi:MAG: hypothetical protein RLZZ338_4454 [Cyanobacteriota bacterium]|jgi:hypothetical protein
MIRVSRYRLSSQKPGFLRYLWFSPTVSQQKPGFFSRQKRDRVPYQKPGFSEISGFPQQSLRRNPVSLAAKNPIALHPRNRVSQTIPSPNLKNDFYELGWVEVRLRG